MMGLFGRKSKGNTGLRYSGAATDPVRCRSGGGIPAYG